MNVLVEVNLKLDFQAKLCCSHLFHPLKTNKPQSVCILCSVLIGLFIGILPKYVVLLQILGFSLYISFLYLMS